MRLLIATSTALLLAASPIAGAAGELSACRGRVTAFSGEPVPDVDVTCTRQGGIVARTKTDDAGNYTLRLPDLGCDAVVFALLGFRTEEFRFPWGDALDVVMEVGRLDDAPNPRVIGDVMTSDGRPAQDASVWLLTIGNHRTDGTRTDAKGRFSFSADGGDYAVCARLPGDEAGAACQAVRVRWLGDTPAPVHLRLPKPGPIRR